MTFVPLLTYYTTTNKETLPESVSMGMSPSGEELWTTAETTSDIL